MYEVWCYSNSSSLSSPLNFPPILWTIDIPSSKVSYSASLLVAEKPSLNDFSKMSFSGEIKTSPTPDPFWFVAPSTYTFHCNDSYIAIWPTDFSSMQCSFDLSSTGVSVNSTIKSARTWPLTEVHGMYLMSKAPKIVPHFTILPV